MGTPEPTIQLMVEEIVQYLYRSGWVTQSVEAERRDLPRWEGRLRTRGIHTVPSRALAHGAGRTRLLTTRSISW